MYHLQKIRGNPRASRRRGLTLTEMLIAMTLMVMLSGGLLALATTVESGVKTVQGQDAAAMHARVVIDRIQRSINAAYANEHFPGFMAFGKHPGQYDLPDSLVIWRPTGAPANPDGLPRWDEMVVYTTDESYPNRIIEIQYPTDTWNVPPLDDESDWEMELSSRSYDMVYSTTIGVLTDLLRVGVADSNIVRGAIRFHVTHTPSLEDMQSFEAGTQDWHDLPWPQDLYGPTSGTRQSWCRFEFQLLPGEEVQKQEPTSDKAIPFFGSAAIYYQLPRS